MAERVEEVGGALWIRSPFSGLAQSCASQVIDEATASACSLSPVPSLLLETAEQCPAVVSLLSCLLQQDFLCWVY